MDDGSCDNTKGLVDQWMKDRLINIQYIYQENQGKPAAHNAAVMAAEAEWICICDSDDILVENAVEIIKSYMKMEHFPIGGMVAYMKMENATYHGRFPAGQKHGKLFELVRGRVFDTCNIYRTSVLRENLFPRFPGERFVPEFAIWTQIDMKYDLVIIPEVIEKGRYLEDGMSLGGHSMVHENPAGYAFLFYNEYRYEKKKGNYINALIHLGKAMAMGRNGTFWKCYHAPVLDKIIAFPVFIVACAKYAGIR